MTTQHLTEDDLVLHYYGETRRREERNAPAHLQRARRATTSYARLQRVLGVGRRDARSPVGAAADTSSARCGRGSSRICEPRAARLGVVARLLAGAAGARGRSSLLVGRRFIAGRSLSPPAAPSPADRGRDAAGTAPRAHSARRSRRASRSIADGAGRARQRRRRRTRRHLGRARARRAAGRRQPALSADREATGDAGVSDLLDELERVLVDVAASPEQVVAGSRRRAAPHRVADLLFKVRVVSAEVRERQKASDSAAGGAPFLTADAGRAVNRSSAVVTRHWQRRPEPGAQEDMD